jgi:hypothetical protein
MSTPNRAEINRNNAQHSTGPITEAGKQRSSMNALKHGLTSKQVIVSTEDRELYESLKKKYLNHYKPQGVTEEDLVQALADLSWRLSRIAVLEANLLSLTFPPEDLLDAHYRQSKILANYSLHSGRLSRQFKEALAQLRSLQETRRSQEEWELDKLLCITDMYEKKGETYNPKEDGFVFTQAQINQAILARNRRILYDESLEDDDDEPTEPEQ